MVIVTITTSDVSKATNGTVQQHGYPFVKEDQHKVVTGIVGGTDVFAVLPTGYGKCLCYACACHWSQLDQLEAESRFNSRGLAIVLVVTLLTVIMDDQVCACRSIHPLHVTSHFGYFCICPFGRCHVGVRNVLRRLRERH